MRNNMATILNVYSPLNFGKHKGKELGLVYLYDPDYVDWLANKDFFYRKH
ncbi:MAG: hypothetical protein ACI9XO_000051 [Paraglaciecola sp.]|jgi:uncharacterized protein (DUF3820 family)